MRRNDLVPVRRITKFNGAGQTDPYAGIRYVSAALIRQLPELLFRRDYCLESWTLPMDSIFDFVTLHLGRLSCILRRPPDAKICHKLAVCYFSFSKVGFKDRQNERRNKDFSNCDFSRFFVKNNCMLRSQ